MPRPIPTKKSRELARGAPKATKEESAEQRATFSVMIVGGVLLVAGGLGTGLYLNRVAGFQQSAIYVQAVDLARHSPRVVEALGEPIEGSIWVEGEHHVSEQHETVANVQIPLSGPKGEGRLSIEAVQGLNGAVQWTKPPYFVTANGKGISLR
jgi:anti-sigma factor RsiW